MANRKEKYDLDETHYNYRNVHAQVMPRAGIPVEVTVTNDIPKHY